MIDPITVFIDGELVDSVSFTEEPFNSGDYRSEGIDLSELPCGIHTVHTQVDNGELVATANAVDIKVIKREPGLSEVIVPVPILPQPIFTCPGTVQIAFPKR